MNRTINIVNLDTGNEKALTVPSAPLTETLTQEMLAWLTDNREDYEFYMLHAMLHDPVRRMSLLSVPVTPDDFRREEYSILIRALTAASKIMGVIGQSLTNPPTVEFLRTYVDSAAKEEGSDDETIGDVMQLLRELQNPSYSGQHYCVGPYFEAWYGSARAKKAARELMKVDIPDVRGILEKLRAELDSASPFTATVEGCEFDFDTTPEPPESLLKLGEHTICTPGNIINIQGPPKAAKSAAIGAIIAATIKKQGDPSDTLGFTAESSDGRAVLHFDTEQSVHAHDALLRRAYSRANRREKVSSLYSYCLTGMEPAMCRDFLLDKLQKATEEHGGIKMVIIDGIADFCTDPNDAEDCFALVRKLHRIAGEYRCGILTVLHENPGSSFGKTRGHLGSHLERKAETSLRLKKDPKTGITEVWADSARHCFIPQGAGRRFRWCDQAKMHVSLDESSSAYGCAKSDKHSKFAEEVSKAFEEVETLSYEDLIVRIIRAVGLAKSTAKARIPDYLAFELLEKDAEGKYRTICNQRCETPRGQSASALTTSALTEITSLS